MYRCLINTFLVFVICSSICAEEDNPDPVGRKLYPADNKQECAFPFTYNGKEYNECTVADGSNGDRPWCSLTPVYEGQFKKCYNFRRSNLKCREGSFTVNGREYTGCVRLPGATYDQCQTTDPNITMRYCTENFIKPRTGPLVHLDDCDPAYKKLAEHHTMCLGPDEHAIQIPISEADKTAILNKHNWYRGNVTAKYMFKLYWDNELAKIAQAHSDMCAFDHEIAKNRVSPRYGWLNGQNMVMSTEIRSTLATLLDIMFKAEKKRFRHSQECAEKPGSCLHYTQLMISDLTRVGCAHTHCVYDDRIERYLTCNYIKSQYTNNWNRPYIESDPQNTLCPLTQTMGYLCDCGDKICNYNEDERLDAKTCSCMKSTRKRSINKRSMDSDAVPSAQKMIVVPTDETETGSNSGDQQTLNAVPLGTSSK